MMIKDFAIVKCRYFNAASGYGKTGQPCLLNTGKEGDTIV
jgi:hypothetical protein